MKPQEATQEVPGGADKAEAIKAFDEQLKALKESTDRLRAMGISVSVKDYLRKHGFEVW